MELTPLWAHVIRIDARLLITAAIIFKLEEPYFRDENFTSILNTFESFGSVFIHQTVIVRVASRNSQCLMRYKASLGTERKSNTGLTYPFETQLILASCVNQTDQGLSTSNRDQCPGTDITWVEDTAPTNLRPMRLHPCPLTKLTAVQFRTARLHLLGPKPSVRSPQEDSPPMFGGAPMGRSY